MDPEDAGSRFLQTMIQLDVPKTAIIRVAQISQKSRSLIIEGARSVT